MDNTFLKWNNIPLDDTIQLRNGLSIFPLKDNKFILFNSSLPVENANYSVSILSIINNKLYKEPLPSNETYPKFRMANIDSLSSRNTYYLYGGVVPLDRQRIALLDDFISYDITTNKFTKIELSNYIIGPKGGNSLNIYKDEYIFLFGGKNIKEQQTNELIKINLKNNTAYRIEALSNNPTKRTNHTATIYKSSLYIFGGWDGIKTLNDMYELNLETFVWYQIIYESALTCSPIYRHCTCLINDHLIIFGGIDEKRTKHNELYDYDIISKQWKLILPNGTNPPSRTFHNMIYDNGYIRIFGGYGSTNKYLNDLYELKVDENKFKGQNVQTPMLYKIDEYEGEEKEKFLERQVKELLAKYNEELWKNICKICCDKKINTVVMPCGHRFVCEECAVKLTKCSECNGKIDYIIKTFS